MSVPTVLYNLSEAKSSSDLEGMQCFIIVHPQTDLVRVAVHKVHGLGLYAYIPLKE
jgi:hypothetical protein